MSVATTATKPRQPILTLAGPKPPPEPPPTPAPRMAKRGVPWAMVNEMAADLMELYPAAFNPSAPRPLAIGIHKAIIADLGCDPKVLSVTLGCWCSGPRYRLACWVGAWRYDLNGEHVGEVTADQVAGRKTP
jgi:hypothetical protein